MPYEAPLCAWHEISFMLIHKGLRVPGAFLTLVGRMMQSATQILDAGCGTGEFVQSLIDFGHIRRVELVGFDAHLPSIQIARKRGIYRDVVCADVAKAPFKRGSFGIVLCADVIEHLKKESGFLLISNLEQLATRRIVFTTPNGFEHPAKSAQSDRENTFSQHKSGWTSEDFTKRGYCVIGSGLAMIWSDRGLIRRLPRAFQPLLAAFSYAVSPFVTHKPRFSAKIICWKNVRPTTGQPPSCSTK